MKRGQTYGNLQVMSQIKEDHVQGCYGTNKLDVFLQQEVSVEKSVWRVESEVKSGQVVWRLGK